MSEQELRYLWVLVSVSATESVQGVLLEGHPSWRYLEEVQTLLLKVQQGFVVSRESWLRVGQRGGGRVRQGRGVSQGWGVSGFSFLFLSYGLNPGPLH